MTASKTLKQLTLGKLRIWKTGVAVFISMLICEMFGLPNSIFAGFAAVVCLKPTISESIKTGIQRIQGSLIGGICGITVSYLMGVNSLTIGIGVVFAIYFCNMFKWQDAVVLSALTVIAVMAGSSDNNLMYSSIRVVNTVIGIVVASAVNMVVIPPRYYKDVADGIKNLNFDATKLYKQSIEAYINADESLAQKVIEKLQYVKTSNENLEKQMNYVEEETRYKYGELKEGVKSCEANKKKQSIQQLEKILNILEDISRTALKRSIERQKLFKKDKINDLSEISEEFKDLCSSLRTLSEKVALLHSEVFEAYFTSVESKHLNTINQKLSELKKLKKEIRKKLKKWHLVQLEHTQVVLVLTASRVVFDLEEIIDVLSETVKQHPQKTPSY